MDRPRLDSWKDIAAHLGRDVRTVARWEHERRLPVHRVPGGGRAHVFAYPDELDAWMAGGQADAMAEPPVAGVPHPGSPRRPDVRVAVGLLVVAATAATGWIVSRSGAPPIRLAAADNAIVALDAAGTSRWTYRFEGRHVASPTGPWFSIGNLGGSAGDETVVAVELTGPALDQRGGMLLRFAADGRLRWTRTLEDRLRFRDGEYGPPWSTDGFVTYRLGDAVRIAWLAHQITWWPGLVVTFDAEGRRLATFVNSGWIRSIVQSTDGRYLLVAGVSNARHAYFLAMIDATHPAGRSPEPPGTATECLGCPEGDPLVYVVFPRTDVGERQPFPANGPALQTFPDGSLQVQTHESAGSGIATMVFDLSPSLELRRTRVSDTYWDWHRRLEEGGLLRHSAQACPIRGGLDVQRWTPATGWQTIRVPFG